MIGVITLVGAAVSTYVGAHFTEVAKVNDQSITQDTLTDRALVDTVPDQRGRGPDPRPEPARAADRRRAQQRLSRPRAAAPVAVELDRSTGSSTRPSRRQLAAQKGITISDAQIDQRLVDEATQKEQRHIAMITIEPEVTTGATAPTDAQKAAAKAAADKALADIKGGKTFEEVAKAVSKDAYAATGGDVGWILADDPSVDPAVVTAVVRPAPSRV